MLLLFNHLSFKILTKFGFKKIWLEKRGKFIELWGEFNSRVLLSYFEGKLDDMPGNASEMKAIKKGGKDWNEAIKAQQKAIEEGKKFQVRVESSSDAKEFLKESQGNMNRYRAHTQSARKEGVPKYPKGYEQHMRPEKGQGDIPHIKYSINGTDGHIFYEIPN